MLESSRNSINKTTIPKAKIDIESINSKLLIKDKELGSSERFIWGGSFPYAEGERNINKIKKTKCKV